MTRHFVYLATSPERYKIGFSGQPHARITTLRAKEKCDLTLYAMIEGTRQLEKSVLKFFKDKRIEGEWFTPCDEIRAWFVCHRNFVDPGVHYHPNSTPQHLLDSGKCSRVHGNGREGPGLIERRALLAGNTKRDPNAPGKRPLPIHDTKERSDGP